MVERFSRSWRLMVQSYAVLMQDKELMLLPILSGLTILVVCASFIVPMGVLAAGTHIHIKGEPAMMAAWFAMYALAYTVGIFFQAAIVAGASQRLAGGSPTLGSALGAAMKRLPSIVAWGLIAGTVGMVLSAVQRRSNLLGKIVISLLGAAWSLATFFVVPVLVLEERTIGDSFKRSWEMVKKTWGETVIGGAGIGLVAMLYWLPLIATVVLLAMANLVIPAIVLGVAGFTVGLVFFSALQSVYLASLYRYAATGEAPAGFAADDFAQAFRRK
jgi:hypothetical protein